MSATFPVVPDVQATVAAGSTVLSPAKGEPTTKVQITVQPSGAASGKATTGTIAVNYKAYGARFFEVLRDQYGAAVTITVAASTSVTRMFDLVAEDIQLVPTGLNGTWDSIVTRFR